LEERNLARGTVGGRTWRSATLCGTSRTTRLAIRETGPEATSGTCYPAGTTANEARNELLLLAAIQQQIRRVQAFEWAS
jgi:hypothetical protein